MTAKSTWEAFFDAHAPVYEDNVFTKNTILEVDFLLEELSLQPGSSILDVGCGTAFAHPVQLSQSPAYQGHHPVSTRSGVVD